IERVHPGAYGNGGRPNRELLREVIFHDEAKKRTLEAILHPVIRNRWSRRAREAEEANRLCVVDIPLLFETKAESLFDRILTVACDETTQLARLTARRGLTPEISRKIIASQLPLGVKIARSHHVIWNDGSLDGLAAQTE